MKRSEINRILKDADEFIAARGFKLPPWAHYSPVDWAERGAEYDEIRDLMLGWDVTDYGQGRFEQVGLTLFTIRNGAPARPGARGENGSSSDPRYPKTYAEKLLISREGQVCPCHFHFHKTEDIINRGGGNLMMQLWQSTPDGELSEDDFTVSSDGVQLKLRAGEILRLEPGQSVTLTPGLYHAFWAEPGHGTVLIGEVSSVNDDNADNRFYVEQSRFPEIEEDEPPYRLLCNEYRR